MAVSEEGCLPRGGVSAQGGVCLGGVCLGGVCPLRGVFPAGVSAEEGLYPPDPEGRHPPGPRGTRPPPTPDPEVHTALPDPEAHTSP